MGVIKEGKVSGLIPSKEGFAVHYPGYPSSISRAIQTLGGTGSILKARSSQSNKLELYFRPEDPYSHSVSGELRSCHSMLLKISRKKKNSSPVNDAKEESEEFHADIVARIPEAYYFEGMADYQHVVPVHADIAMRKRKNPSEMEEPHFQKKHGLIDMGPEDVMMLSPPLFSLKDVPENIVLRPPSTSSSKKKQDEPPETHSKMTFEPALGIDFKDVQDILMLSGFCFMSNCVFRSFLSILILLLEHCWPLAFIQIPKKINWKEFITEGTPMWEWQIAVSELFEERPIWPKYSLIERLLDQNLKFTYQTLKRLLLTVGYYFSGGPFQKFWIRKGYDPRKDPDSRIYQSVAFRVPPELKSYCDDNAAKGLKHRWEDLCKFRFFPYRNQYSFQLYELDDDYIQQEIQKPPKQTSCTVSFSCLAVLYETGWFSQHVHDSLRLCVKVRFLSIFPETGAEKFLKAASEKFMKSKRACIYKDAPKPVQEEHQQINEDHETLKNDTDAVDEAIENQIDTDDVEVDELESDDGEEEFDVYGMDSAGEADNLSLNSYSHMENTSTSYLQQLLGSFPSMDTNGDKKQDGGESSDGEYQIYEQDDDENYLDDDDE
ncbi:general transcription factor 3C polypeptide 5-like isoform X2 [Populus alba x Populus x berolinensis]|nr:general transcription factor 3C polypeptide 5-like isoform X2 [Populus alba x Populus x berolinensis]